MSAWTAFASVAAFATGAMLAGWAWQVRTRNAGIVDVIWSAGVGVSAILHGVLGEGATWLRVLVATLGALWGLRLATHLARRVLGENEDGRYAALRTHWKGDQRRFLALFLAQAVLIVLFSVPFWIAARNPVDGLTPWSVLAIATWLLAVGGESLADRQLAAHRADPSQRRRTCRRGLWRWSRHPNYFFEWLHWFTYVFLAIGGGVAGVLASLAGPALMLAMLYRVSGIPYSEAQALRSRGDDYRDYQRTTSAFFPWFPRDAATPPADTTRRAR